MRVSCYEFLADNHFGDFSPVEGSCRGGAEGSGEKEWTEKDLGRAIPWQKAGPGPVFQDSDILYYFMG
jgi:hypothetical protein